jgi:outer membrane lipoprotein-sorting protein
MIRLRAILAPFALVLLTLPAAAQELSLDAISRYLNSLQTAQGEFTQINADGTISTGTLYIRRPGRMRFEYDPPDGTLVVASAGTVAVFDGGSNISTPEQYPLVQTPLNLILESNVDLSRRNMVTGRGYDGTATTVTAQDPAHPEYGSIQLKFTANPVELRQWIVTDGAGNRTTVALGALTKGGNLSARLFSIAGEIAQRDR